jgi:hypothetical protein
VANSSAVVNSPTTTNDAAFENALGQVYVNGTQVNGFDAGLGGVECIAVDFTNSKIWFRKGATGNWNNDVIANQNPATGTGGYSLSGLTTPLFPRAHSNTDNSTYVLNVAGAFAGAVPSGFVAWDSAAAVAQSSAVTVICG